MVVGLAILGVLTLVAIGEIRRAQSHQFENED
jgi:hypothetical protein